jgi:UDP-N-acetylglucosamine 2-epimerase
MILMQPPPSKYQSHQLLSIVGARPQFIKIAPVSRAINNLNKKEGREFIKDIVVHTGQHYDYEMSDIFFKELEIKEPDYNLGVGSGSHGVRTGEMLRKIEEVLIKEEPDIVMVYGDTNSLLQARLLLQSSISGWRMWRRDCEVSIAPCLRRLTGC